MKISGFAPVVSGTPHSLILGSMPGVASLQAQQYYGHPRNAFWPIVSELLGFSPELPYEQRLHALNESGYALWDVLGHCQRKGSLDADIREAEANDFAGLLAEYPSIERVFLNGGAAAKLWKRHVVPTLPSTLLAIPLPSTSPAYAAMSRVEKSLRWQQIVR